MSATLLANCPVPYKLLNKATDNGKYTFSITNDGRTEQLVFLVAFENRGAFIDFVAGYSTSAGGVVTRNQPLQDPFTTYLYAVQIDGEGIGADNLVGLNRPWSHIKFTITFGTLVWDPNGATPYYSVRYRASTSTITVPGAKLAFSNGEYIDHDYGVLVGQFAIEITKYQVPAIGDFVNTYAPLSGQVNSDTVTIQGYNYSPGHLMLPTVDAESQVNSLGAPQNQATVALIYRSIPWNSGIRSDGMVDSITPAPYQVTAFSPAFS